MPNRTDDQLIADYRRAKGAGDRRESLRCAREMLRRVGSALADKPELWAEAPVDRQTVAA